MPTYEYRCPKGHLFEHFFRTISTAESRMKCPECGEDAERILSGGTGLLFKGSGFYITDYGKDGKKDQRDAAKKPDAKPDSKPESKPAAGDGGASAPASKSESSSEGSTTGGGGTKE